MPFKIGLMLRANDDHDPRTWVRLRHRHNMIGDMSITRIHVFGSRTRYRTLLINPLQHRLSKFLTVQGKKGINLSTG